MAHGDSKIIVIGCGKRLSGDDSAALEVLSRLHDVPDLGCELRTYEEGCPLGFLAEIPADALVVFIDSVREPFTARSCHRSRWHQDIWDPSVDTSLILKGKSP